MVELISDRKNVDLLDSLKGFKWGYNIGVLLALPLAFTVGLVTSVIAVTIGIVQSLFLAPKDIYDAATQDPELLTKKT